MNTLAITSNPAKETATTVTLEWTPPAGAQGYVFLKADGTRLSSTLDGSRSSVKVSKSNLPLTVRAFRTDSEGVYPPPVVPPSSGTTRTATPGQANAVIGQSAPGDTVVLAQGAHPKLVLTKTFAAPGITVKCAAGGYVQGVDTNSQSGYTFYGIESRIPVEANDWDITPFYLHGGSERIRLTGAFKITGGYDGVKQYGDCKDCVIDDGGATSNISGYGGDGIHVNGAIRFRIVSVAIGAPWQQGTTPEHNDGIHAQAFQDLYIGPGVRCTALGPRSDVDSAGIFIQKDGGVATGFVLEGAKIHWQIGRGMQLMWVDGRCEVHDPQIVDSGIPGESPLLTVDANAGQRVDLYGLAKSDVYFNTAQAAKVTVFH